MVESRTITVELFGVPRLRAGTGMVRVEASDVGQAIRALGGACPALVGSVIDAVGGVCAAYRLNLNGDRFVDDPATPLEPGDALILLAADVGG
jgi:molybdopterin converting factor small subunit